MKVFILLSVFALAFAGDRECGENSHYESCGTACPLTCENHDNPPKACILMCNIGCHCDEGYVKTKDGRCVRPFECPQEAPQCGENSHYESCGTSCPLTCENYANPPRFCNLMCNSGCYCDEGYVKTREGRCIKSFQCPQNASQVCGENERYSTCGTACPLTCDNHNNPPKICVAMCKIGCECEAGFVRSRDGQCVRPEECSSRAECGENKHYNPCGTSCPLTCENYANPPKFCNKKCNPGCHCDEGYVRTTEGRCIKSFQCPENASQVCGENERYSTCGTACPLTCDNYNNPPKICPLMCKIGCECEKGFVRSSDGRCVRPEECPSRADLCGENERYSTCGTACPLTCDNYNNPPKICPLMCKIGCQCEKGFVRSSDGRCVRPEQCSSRTDFAEACDMPSETGVCRGFFPRFYFDRTTGQCQKFVYGGCGGNENNFETIEECQQTCSTTQLSSDVCSKKAEVGLCRGYFPRYYYNEEKRRCQKFIYGGCGGNGNNFETLEECKKTCVA